MSQSEAAGKGGVVPDAAQSAAAVKHLLEGVLQWTAWTRCHILQWCWRLFFILCVKQTRVAGQLEWAPTPCSASQVCMLCQTRFYQTPLGS